MQKDYGPADGGATGASGISHTNTILTSSIANVSEPTMVHAAVGEQTLGISADPMMMTSITTSSSAQPMTPLVQSFNGTIMPFNDTSNCASGNSKFQSLPPQLTLLDPSRQAQSDQHLSQSQPQSQPPSPPSLSVEGARTTKKGEPQRTCFATYVQGLAKIDTAVADAYYRLGMIVGSSPVKVAVIVTLLCLGAAGCFARVQAENEPAELWIPDDSITEHNAEIYQSLFDGVPSWGLRSEFTPDFVLIEAVDGGSVLRPSIVSQVWKLNTAILELAGGEATFSVTMGIVQQWSTENDFVADSAYNISRKITQFACDPFHRVAVAGVTGCPSRPVKEYRSSPQGSVTASALKLFYRFAEGRNSDDYKFDIRTNIINLVEGWSSDGGIAATVIVWNSLGRELERAILGDITLTIATMIVMCAYVALNIGSLDRIHGRLWVGIAAVAAVLISTVGAFGLTAIAGVKFTSLTPVLPFLFIGVGVDDAFIITAAFDRLDRSIPAPKRIALALREVGPAITMTSLTDVLAFASGVSSNLLAVRSFCTYAAAGIAVDFLVQITFFPALLVLDANRADSGRSMYRPSTCCAASTLPTAVNIDPSSPQTPHQHGRLHRLRDAIHGHVMRAVRSMIRPRVRIAMMALFAVMNAMLAWAAVSGLKVGQQTQDITPWGSFVVKYVEMNERHFLRSLPGQQIYFVYPDIDICHRQDLAYVVDTARLVGSLEGIDQSYGIHNAIEHWLRWIPDGCSHVVRPQAANGDNGLTLGQYMAQRLPSDCKLAWACLIEYRISNARQLTLAKRDAARQTRDLEINVGSNTIWERTPLYGDWHHDFSTHPSLSVLSRNITAFLESDAVRLPELVGVRVRAFHQAFSEQHRFEYSQAMKRLRDDVAQSIGGNRHQLYVSSGLRLLDDTNVADDSANDSANDSATENNSGDITSDPFPFRWFYSDLERFLGTWPTIVRTVVLALTATGIVTVFALAHPMAVVLVLATVACVINCLGGMMTLWGIWVNEVSVVNVIMAIGFAIDYSSHVAAAFMTKEGTRTKRVIAALGDVGVPVVNGAVTTLVATVFLAFGSPIFVVFSKMLFGIVAFGLIHGVVLLPLVLATIGPDCIRPAKDGAKDGA